MISVREALHVPTLGSKYSHENYEEENWWKQFSYSKIVRGGVKKNIDLMVPEIIISAAWSDVLSVPLIAPAATNMLDLIIFIPDDSSPGEFTSLLESWLWLAMLFE